MNRLSPRQVQVLELAAAGATTRETAHMLGTAAETVKDQRSSIMQKLHARSFTHAVAIWYGIVEPPRVQLEELEP